MTIATSRLCPTRRSALGHGGPGISEGAEVIQSKRQELVGHSTVSDSSSEAATTKPKAKAKQDGKKKGGGKGQFLAEEVEA